ncbi:MAG: transposase [Eggerthellaceae bacterium]|nr:transposase [Eggerthellaceae bacterium]
MRAPRKRSEGEIYHVIARGTGRQLIFEDDSDRKRFLEYLSDDLRLYEAELYAWCLMGNHVHLLIHASMDKLSKCMMHTCGQYARYYNEKSGRVGHLFQERFKSEPITDDEYLLTVIRYIHANPAKAGLSTIECYPWSSYGEYMGAPRLCKTEFPLSVFGGVESFKKFHECEEESSCLDVGLPQDEFFALTDARAVEIAQAAIGDIATSDVKALPRAKRDEKLRLMKRAGLSVRQIERLTGVGRSTISRA